MKKIIGLALGCAFVFSNFASTVTAQGIIPETTTYDSNDQIVCQIPSGDTAPDGRILYKPNPAIEKDIGAKIFCGSVTLNDFPALIVYLIQWVLTLAGSIAVIMVMIGGFQYMLGGVTDDKERGKKTIIYALGGLVVAFMAWWIVELIQVWITS